MAFVHLVSQILGFLCLWEPNLVFPVEPNFCLSEPNLMQFLMFGAFGAIVFAFLCFYEQNCGFSRPFGAFVWRFVTFRTKFCFFCMS